jgi:hypothetical protein
MLEALTSSAISPAAFPNRFRAARSSKAESITTRPHPHPRSPCATHTQTHASAGIICRVLIWMHLRPPATTTAGVCSRHIPRGSGSSAPKDGAFEQMIAVDQCFRMGIAFEPSLFVSLFQTVLLTAESLFFFVKQVTFNQFLHSNPFFVKQVTFSQFLHSNPRLRPISRASGFSVLVSFHSRASINQLGSQKLAVYSL